MNVDEFQEVRRRKKKRTKMEKKTEGENGENPRAPDFHARKKRMAVNSIVIKPWAGMAWHAHRS